MSLPSLHNRCRSLSVLKPYFAIFLLLKALPFRPEVPLAISVDFLAHLTFPALLCYRRRVKAAS
jgi:hypothetical protein